MTQHIYPRPVPDERRELVRRLRAAGYHLLYECERCYDMPPERIGSLRSELATWLRDLATYVARE